MHILVVEALLIAIYSTTWGMTKYLSLRLLLAYVIDKEEVRA
jgi:hypothetical protein